MFVRREAGADTAIGEQVESLLAAHDRADGFLSQGAMDGNRNGHPRRFAPGTRLGRIRDCRALGTGGMGEVYRARDTRLDREVAIKVLAGELAADPQCRERLEREARVVSRLDAPAHLHAPRRRRGGGRWHQGKFLVMELIEGETLASRLLRGPLPPGQAIQVALETLDALSTAHAAASSIAI